MLRVSYGIQARYSIVWASGGQACGGGVIYRSSCISVFVFCPCPPSFGGLRVGLVYRYRGRTHTILEACYGMIPVSYYGMLCVQSALFKGWEMIVRHAVDGYRWVGVRE